MTRAPNSITEAIRGFPPGEDRTTAVLAAVCTIHRPFASRMLRKAAEVDEVRADSIEANLQVVIPSGRRVDLELVGRAAGGDVVRVWIEAKWTAVFQRDQLLDYERALGDRGTLIAVLPAARSSEVPTQFRAWTWEQIAVLADESGRDHGGPHWRHAADDPLAPACQRVLSLFLEHLEREHHMPTRPLLTDHAVAIRLADEALDIADRLGDESIARAGLEVIKGGSFGYNASGAWWRVAAREALATTDAWHPNGYLELMRHPRGAHQDGPLEPVFLFGHTLPKAAIDLLEADRLIEWRRRLAEADPLFKLSGGRSQPTRVVAAMQLAQVATASTSFDGQVEFLTAWIIRALDMLGRLAPDVSWDAP